MSLKESIDALDSVVAERDAYKERSEKAESELADLEIEFEKLLRDNESQGAIIANIVDTRPGGSVERNMLSKRGTMTAACKPITYFECFLFPPVGADTSRKCDYFKKDERRSRMFITNKVCIHMDEWQLERCTCRAAQAEALYGKGNKDEQR